MAISYTERPLTVADAAGIAAVYRAMEKAEPADEMYTETDVIEELESPAVDLPRSSIGVFDGQELIAFGLPAVSAPSSVWKAVILGGVLPQYSGQGIGRRLLDRVEAMALRDRDRDAPGRAGELKIFVLDKRRRTTALAAAAGYSPWRYFFRMRRELPGPAAVPDVQPGVQIRRYEDSDDGPLLAVSNESFADHWGSTPMDPQRWRAMFSGSASARPGHSWVGLLDGEIVSFVLSSEYDGDTEARGYRTGYLGRIGTVRSARGRGIAAALIGRTLQGMAADGYRFAELDVDAESPTGAGRLYQRLGFETVDRSTLVGKRF